MNNKTTRRPIARLMAVLMALAMVVSVVFIQASAEKAEFAPPTKAMDVNQKNWITTAAHSQGWITPEVLGITNTTSRTQELPVNADGTVGMDLATAKKHAALGVFGSDINDSPNPFHYNYFYNTYAADKGLTPSALGTYTLSQGIVGIGPAQAATTPGYSKYGTNVPASFYLEPDILLGVGSIDTSTNPPTTGYTTALNTYNEAKLDAEPGAAPYDPYQIDYVTPHVYSFLQTMYDLADVVDDIKAADNTKATRYGDPQVITGDIEKYVKGLEAYVIKQMKKDNVQPLTVAVVDSSTTDTLRGTNSIQSNEFVLNDKNTSSQSTTTFSRVGEFVEDTSVNLVDAIGNLQQESQELKQGQRTYTATYYVCTADQIAELADVVLFCDVLSSVPENQGNSKVDEFKQDVADNCTSQALKDRVNDIEMMSSAFDCVGSIGANSCENLLGMAYYAAYLYPQYLNQFDVAAYWYQNFYHVSDLDKLATVMASNFATSSVQDAYADKYSATKMNYSKDDVEAKIIEGMRYYEANESEFKDKLIYQNGKTGENSGWVIDWTRGIGAGKQNMLNGLAKGTDGKWAMYKDDVVQKNYTGLAKSTYNNKWYYLKNGYVAWDYTGFGKNLDTGIWWRVVNGRVDFNANSIYKKPENSVWYKTTNGKVTWKENSIYKNANGWYKTTNSRVTFKENGVFKNQNGWWKVKNSKVDFSYNGLASNKNGTWKIKNGKVDFDFSGTYQGKTIKNGKVV